MSEATRKKISLGLYLLPLAFAVGLTACGGGGGGSSSPPPPGQPPPNATPSISSLSPSSATARGPAFILTVNGTGFISASVVQWNGSSRTTTFVRRTQLTARISASDIATPNTVAQVTVFNPTPGGGVSNAVSFSMVSGAAVLNRVSVASDGSPANGRSFTAAMSPNGRFIAFASDASNLVPNDTNNATDIFLYD